MEEDLFSILESTQPGLSNPVLLEGFKVMVTINCIGEFLYIVKVEFDNSTSYGDSKIFALFIEDNLNFGLIRFSQFPFQLLLIGP